MTRPLHKLQMTTPPGTMLPDNDRSIESAWIRNVAALRTGGKASDHTIPGQSASRDGHGSSGFRKSTGFHKIYDILHLKSTSFLQPQEEMPNTQV